MKNQSVPVKPGPPKSLRGHVWPGQEGRGNDPRNKNKIKINFLKRLNVKPILNKINKIKPRNPGPAERGLAGPYGARITASEAGRSPSAPHSV